MTVFADGRVEGRESARTLAQLRVPVTRVEKLAADLAATGVFAQKDGSWVPRSPVADGFGAQIIARDKAAECATPVPCACQAGDPLCSCL